MDHMNWRKDFDVDDILDDFHFIEKEQFVTAYPQVGGKGWGVGWGGGEGAAGSARAGCRRRAERGLLWVSRVSSRLLGRSSGSCRSSSSSSSRARRSSRGRSSLHGSACSLAAA
jgi:hypothetical protein